MSDDSRSWFDHPILSNRTFLLEAFVLSNIGFLIADIYVAHSLNEFAHWGEYVPLVYTAAGTVALAVSVGMQWGRSSGFPRASWWTGEVVGWMGVAVGVIGFGWHLEAWFFEATTLKSLVYSAPFIAPLAFAGLGLLLIMNRRLDGASVEWAQWVVFMAWGGWVGNFALSLADHAQNAFFYATEWIPVIVAAFAVGSLAMLLLQRPNDRDIHFAYIVLGANAGVGVLGFFLHIAPIWTEPSGATLWDQIVFGAPVFAPLLFVDLAVLSFLGVWSLHEAVRAPGPVEELA
ncbi:hypothetical protein CRI94_16280 [Longibacter salinarum]|uniref:Uncharacterized protein n=1 Tax=Longibacter salinarum TaxID=1850348 RepID=A0A2A8CUW7_9BACT|nr:hypothetical protein [Longibacter salinarum]PEN11341.1 hypothetical protein CRI94_16280 [Longibacter salinarum]